MNGKSTVCSRDDGKVNNGKYAKGIRPQKPALNTTELFRSLASPRGGTMLELDFTRSLEERYGIKEEGIF